MANTYTELREKITGVAAHCARKAIAAAMCCEVVVIQRQLGLELQCTCKGSCASIRIDWMLVLATHDHQALFDYHIGRLATKAGTPNVQQ